MPAQSMSSCRDAASGTVLPWLFRWGVAGCYIGHGAFGVVTKAVWVPAGDVAFPKTSN